MAVTRDLTAQRQRELERLAKRYAVRGDAALQARHDLQAVMRTAHLEDGASLRAIGEAIGCSPAWALRLIRSSTTNGKEPSHGNN